MTRTTAVSPDPLGKRCRGRSYGVCPRREDASITVEAIIIVPVIMLVILLMVQMVLWARAAQVVRVAASEGARSAVSATGGPDAGVNRARAVLAASGSDLESAEVVTRAEPGDQLSVVVTGRALTVLPGFSLPVSATQTAPIQEFRASE